MPRIPVAPSKALATALLLFAADAPVSAQSVSYQQCLEIVEMHAIVLEARAPCRLRLDPETEDLGFYCVSVLGERDRKRVIKSGEAFWAAYKAKFGKRACGRFCDDFYPLLSQ